MKEIKTMSGLTKAFVVLITIIAIAGVAASAYLYRENFKLKNPNQVAEQQVKDIVAEVSKVIVLPTDEVPSLATVADPEKLADQPFFAHALTGDVVIVYAKAKRAILWRPSTKQVVEVSPLNLPEDASTE